jgi:ABC-type polysaccharide/polyol phosphate export permease
MVAAGLLPWASLREGIEGAAGVLPEQRWIRRSRVPLELLVGRLVLVSAARGVVGLALVQVAAAATGQSPGPFALLLPFLGIALQVVATWGLGLGIAPLGVLFPDLRPALASGLTLLTFASPIVYPERLVPAPLLRVLELNPYTHLLRLYRPPATAAVAVHSLLIATAFAAVSITLGLWVRRQYWWAARDRL